ncbi:hypothetical protein OEZ86_005267 [Tetradesmus obliquus]|nr:hypothetical protein OEZ86_005267 [Tetradesmus obliquus]
MVTMPPGRDSMDGFGVERSRGSRWSLAGSVAGMASSVAAAVRFRAGEGGPGGASGSTTFRPQSGQQRECSV